MAALQHHNFRLLFAGQLVAALGTQMQAIAIGWHMYQMTGSPAALGLTAFFRVVPFMALSLVGGAIADAVDRRKLLMLTQGLQMCVTMFLVIATFLDVDEAWVIYVVAFMGGGLQAFDAPARQALIPNLVPRTDLTNALTLNSMVRQAATVVGPGIGGMSVAAFGLGPTYLANALSTLAVVAALVAMRGVTVRPAPTSGSNIQRIADGLTFARGEPLVFLPLVLDFITRALGSPRSLLPVFASDIFDVGPAGLGWLASASAVGGVMGGVALSSIRHAPRPIVLMLCAYFIEGLSNAGFGLSPNVVVAWIMLFAGGVANVVGEVMFVTIGQLRTPDGLRGRTTALANMLTSGGPQMGQFEGGLLGQAIGPVPALAFNGFAAAATTVSFAAFSGLRRHLGTRSMEDLAVEHPRAAV